MLFIYFSLKFVLDQTYNNVLEQTINNYKKLTAMFLKTLYKISRETYDIYLFCSQFNSPHNPPLI